MRNRKSGFYRLDTWLLGLLGIVLISGLFFSFFRNAGKQEQQNYEVYEMQAKGEVYSATAIIRSGPGTGYEKIGVIRKEDPVIITGYAYDTVQTMWYRVRYDEETGFVRHDLILVAEEVSANTILNKN